MKFTQTTTAQTLKRTLIAAFEVLAKVGYGLGGIIV